MSELYTNWDAPSKCLSNHPSNHPMSKCHPEHPSSVVVSFALASFFCLFCFVFNSHFFHRNETFPFNTVTHLAIASYFWLHFSTFDWPCCALIKCNWFVSLWGLKMSVCVPCFFGPFLLLSLSFYSFPSLCSGLCSLANGPGVPFMVEHVYLCDRMGRWRGAGQMKLLVWGPVAQVLFTSPRRRD